MCQGKERAHPAGIPAGSKDLEAGTCVTQAGGNGDQAQFSDFPGTWLLLVCDQVKCRRGLHGVVAYGEGKTRGLMGRHQGKEPG